MRTACLVIAGVALNGADHAARANEGAPADIRIDQPYVLLVDDALTSVKPTAGEEWKEAVGGEFSSAGWRARKEGDRLMIALKRAEGFEGKLEIEMDELDWVQANTATKRPKILFLSMFSNAKMDNHVEHGGTNEDALWGLRGGMAPNGEPVHGNSFVLTHASRGAKRCEPSDFEEALAPMRPGWSWSGKRHRLRIVWSGSAGVILVYANDQLVLREPWLNQVTPLRYVSIGKSSEFSSFVGPVFKNLKVYGVASLANVNQTPSVALRGPLNGAAFAPGTSIPLEVDATDDGRIRKVEFFQGESKIGEDKIAPFNLIWKRPAEGWYEVSARAVDDKGATATSRPKFITVGVPSRSRGIPHRAHRD